MISTTTPSATGDHHVAIADEYGWVAFERPDRRLGRESPSDQRFVLAEILVSQPAHGMLSRPAEIAPGPSTPAGAWAPGRAVAAEG